MAALLVLCAAACVGDAPPVTFSVTLQVVDESEAPIPGAMVDVGAASLVTDGDGQVVLRDLSGPALAVIEAGGFLSEPITVGRTDADGVVAVRLLSDEGGTRWVMHSAGDVMMGRRYEAPTSGDQPLVTGDPAGSARYVVDAVGRAFAAADLSTVNLETVMSDLPAEAAYPGKNVVINSRPETLAGLDALGVDAVSLANNHIRDYLDIGVTETMAALDAAGIPHTGASDGSNPADEPLIFEQDGVRVGMLAWTTLDGSYINDSYPDDGDSMPTDVDEESRWLYEARPWGYTGTSWSVPETARRIGTAWRLFADAEPLMTEAEIVAAWNSLVSVYPELQDWVAQRGHGGAASWDPAVATAAISALAERVDVVVVQIHAGYEYQSAPSGYATSVAHDAIDAGADLVVAHHPHVLQGMEWYKGGLIAYSMGNFVFDQDLFVTFPSAFLRTVWEGDTLIEARVVLLELDGYRPKPVADAVAERSALRLWEKSQLDIRSDVDTGGTARTYLTTRAPDARPAHVHMRHHDAVLTDTAPPVETLSVSAPAGVIVPLAYAGLIHAQANGADVLMGRDLFGWGSFEDALADSEPTSDTHWKIEGNYVGVQVGAEAAGGVGHLTLRRTDKLSGDAYVRAHARIPLLPHQIYRDEGGATVPADGTARYSVRLLARFTGQGEPYVRLDLYGGGSGAMEAARGSKLDELVLPIDIPADGDWHALEIDIPPEAMMIGGVQVTAVLPYVRLSPPEAGKGELSVDDLCLIEWRPAREMPDVFGIFEYVRNAGTSNTTVSLDAMPLRAR